MGKLFKQFIKYFNSCTEKQKKQDWEELKEYNNYEPTVKLWTKETEICQD